MKSFNFLEVLDKLKLSENSLCVICLYDRNFWLIYVHPLQFWLCTFGHTSRDLPLFPRLYNDFSTYIRKLFHLPNLSLLWTRSFHRTPPNFNICRRSNVCTCKLYNMYFIHDMKKSSTPSYSTKDRHKKSLVKYITAHCSFSSQ